jgi:hypothetical protein
MTVPNVMNAMNDTEKQGYLLKRGAALGLTTAEVTDYVIKYGPYVVELLFKLLEWKRTPQGAMQAAVGIGDNLLKRLLLDFIAGHIDDVAKWIEAGEVAVFDAIVKMIAGKNQVIAALLEQYKKTILAIDDKLVLVAIDAVIAALKGQPTPTPDPVDPPRPFIPPFIPPVFRAEEAEEK